MAGSAYYDSSVFLRSCDERASERTVCQSLVSPSMIIWRVAISDLCLAESTIKEFIEQFEVQCILQGVEFKRVTMIELQAMAKNHRSLKGELDTLGCQGRDWKHIMAAVTAKVSILITADQDFIDPRNKSTRGKGRASVKTLLLKKLNLQVAFPEAAYEVLTDSA